MEKDIIEKMLVDIDSLKKNEDNSSNFNNSKFK